MARVHLLRVFCGEDERGGNPLAVFLDGATVAPALRQAVAADLGLSETVFVENRSRGELRIFTPAVELPFAGHPTVGTSWLLAHEGAAVDVLRPPAGQVPVRADGDRWFVAARPEWSPPFRLEQLESAAAVEALAGPPDDDDLIVAWAWSDEPAGVVRARVFLSRIGIAEDEATGSAAVRLAATLQRPLDIHQGRGSRILARPVAHGRVEIGGHTRLDERREYEPPNG